MPPVLFVVLAAVWFVAWFVVRRRVYRGMLERRISIGRGSAVLGLLLAAVPLFYLVLQPETLPLVLGVSVLVFLMSTGATYLLFRLMGPKPSG